MTPNIIAQQDVDTRSWLMLIALSLLWGASFLFIKIAATDIPVFSLVFLRVALAALVLHEVVRWRRWSAVFCSAGPCRCATRTRSWRSRRSQ